MAKVIMVLGTMSGVGKSLVTAGLLRVFTQDGYKALPFKSQNMALNSFITDEGLEMGRAQAMQAQAANVKPSVLMNPILLKPTTDMGSQVIVNGISIGNMSAADYFKYKHKLIPDIKKAFLKLSEEADIIVIEGAGSPSEINLKSEDIVNMGMAKMVDSNAILVGDIDRGGVFAQLYGTIKLLDVDEQARIKGLVINKFRGDRSILDPGITMLEDITDTKVVGCLPYTRLIIDDEDSQSERLDNKNNSLINIAAIKLPRMSNYSDFTSFERIKGVSVNYVNTYNDIILSDMVIIPGSKNSIADLRYLKENGLDKAIIEASKTKIIFGICGGYQMLGESIIDPSGIEGGGSIEGLKLININTVLLREKTRTQVEGIVGDIDGELSCISNMDFSGYEIHMGKTTAKASVKTLANINTVNGKKADSLEGAYSKNIYGTYIHGFFDNSDIALSIVKHLADKKGLDIRFEAMSSLDEFLNTQYDLLADMIRQNMDMDKIYGLLKDVNINED